jgi:hypothetical protein
MLIMVCLCICELVQVLSGVGTTSKLYIRLFSHPFLIVDDTHEAIARIVILSKSSEVYLSLMAYSEKMVHRYLDRTRFPSVSTFVRSLQQPFNQSWSEFSSLQQKNCRLPVYYSPEAKGTGTRS